MQGKPINEQPQALPLYTHSTYNSNTANRNNQNSEGAGFGRGNLDGRPVSESSLDTSLFMGNEPEEQSTALLDSRRASSRPQIFSGGWGESSSLHSHRGDSYNRGDSYSSYDYQESYATPKVSTRSKPDLSGIHDRELGEIGKLIVMLDRLVATTTDPIKKADYQRKLTEHTERYQALEIHLAKQQRSGDGGSGYYAPSSSQDYETPSGRGHYGSQDSLHITTEQYSGSYKIGFTKETEAKDDDSENEELELLFKGFKARLEIAERDKHVAVNQMKRLANEVAELRGEVAQLKQLLSSELKDIKQRVDSVEKGKQPKQKPDMTPPPLSPGRGSSPLRTGSPDTSSPWKTKPETLVNIARDIVSGLGKILDMGATLTEDACHQCFLYGFGKGKLQSFMREAQGIPVNSDTLTLRKELDSFLNSKVLGAKLHTWGEMPSGMGPMRPGEPGAPDYKKAVMELEAARVLAYRVQCVAYQVAMAQRSEESYVL